MIDVTEIKLRLYACAKINVQVRSGGDCLVMYMSLANLCKTVTLKKTENWFSRPIVSKELHNAPLEAFCNTFDLH